MKRVTILGSAGAVGNLLASSLGREGVAVVGVDLVEQDGLNGRFPVIRADVTSPGPELGQAVAESDCVIVSLPEAAALAGLPFLCECVEPGMLIVDTLSVKSRFASEAVRLDEPIELLGMNPMFAPDLGFAGQNVAVVPTRAGRRAEAFTDMLRRWGARVSFMSAAEHDWTSAQIQTMTHAAILAFAAALVKLRYDFGVAGAMLTPPHRALLGLVARIVTGSPDVYWDIQAGNPFGADVRNCLTEACGELDALIHAGDRNGFERLLGDIHAMFGEDMPLLAAEAVRAFRQPSTPLV